jgi:hypothetical protein
MKKIGFVFSLYEAQSGARIVTQSISGDKMTPVLKEIAKTVDKYRRDVGPVRIETHKVRLGETAIVAPEKIESINTLVQLATDEYKGKSEVVVENNFPKSAKDALAENVKKVLTDPAKTKKLMTALRKKKV